jgi:hypothetical protein
MIVEFKNRRNKIILNIYPSRFFSKIIEDDEEYEIYDSIFEEGKCCKILRFIKKQTEEICLAAIKTDKQAIQFLKG